MQLLATWRLFPDFNTSDMMITFHKSWNSQEIKSVLWINNGLLRTVRTTCSTVSAGRWGRICRLNVSLWPASLVAARPSPLKKSFPTLLINKQTEGNSCKEIGREIYLETLHPLKVTNVPGFREETCCSFPAEQQTESLPHCLSQQCAVCKGFDLHNQVCTEQNGKLGTFFSDECHLKRSGDFCFYNTELL